MFTRILFVLLAFGAFTSASAQSADKAKADSVTTNPLQVYTGTYSHPELPLQIEVQVEKGALQAQATGQPAFTLAAAGKHTFKYEAAGVVLIFDPEQKQLTLQQRGKTFVFTK